MTMGGLPATMEGVVLSGHGGLDMLEYRTDLPTPRPGARDVVIKVGAAGVNNTDINTRVGWYSKSGQDSDDASWAGEPLRFPRIQGIDACGEIVAIGDDVDPSRLGERVLVETCLLEHDGRELPDAWFYGSECDGAFAQYTKVASRHAIKINSPWTDVELASFPCSYSTAENMLVRAGLSAGEHVLITGASGGVGSAAVQLAKARGAEVSVVTTATKSDEMRKLGASQIVMRDVPPLSALGRDSVDVVVDLVGGPSWASLLDVLKPQGRYVVSGAVGGAMVELDLRTLYLKDLRLIGATRLEEETFPNLIRLIEDQAIRPLVAATYPLREIKQAQTAFQEKRHVGKIVLKI